MRVLLLIGIITLTGCASDPAPAPPARSLGDALRVDTTGYARADRPRAFRFPEDHGPHPDYRLEWWYLTGNLESESGRRFGYQFTIFRTALDPPGAPSDSVSAWRDRQLYSAHFALSDIDGAVFRASERFSRPGPGLAGASAAPFRVWLEDWELTGDPEWDTLSVRAASPEEGGYAIDLQLIRSKPLVFQGDEGFSPKGYEPGQASYYYSATRWAAQGTVRSGDEELAVRGQSWMDREWSTSLLSEDQTGWDWFSLQLSDGYDLMLFELRSTSGRPFREATLVDPDGEVISLGGGEERSPYRIDPTGVWTSPAGAEYPSGWSISGPDLDLVVEPRLQNQELDVSVRYWEGSVRVEGTHQGREVDGVGYVELTGYADDEVR